MWLIIDTVIVLTVMLFFIKGALKNYHSHKQLSYLSIVLAFLFFVGFFLRTFWIGNVYEYSDNDLLTLTHIIVMSLAVVFYFFVRLFKKNALSNIIFFLYLVSIALIFLSPLNFRLFSIILSFFFMLLIFLNLIDYSNVQIKTIGYLALIYAGMSVIISFLLLFGASNNQLFILLMDLLLLPLAYFMSFELKQPTNHSGKLYTSDSVFLVFMKYFIFILAFTNLVLIGTLGLHEFSHVAVARYYDCDARAIFFEKGIYPYSEINCIDIAGKNIITLAGPVLPILVAIVLFFVGSPITQAVAFLAIGFNLVAGYKDFVEVGISESIILVFMLFGLFLLFIGIFYLAKFILSKESKPAS